MTAKVRIKAGPVEFEYEGETELGVSDIKDLFTHIETLFKVPILAEVPESHSPAVPPASNPPAGAVPAQKLHINSIATKLKAKTGPEVAEAAAAALQIYENKHTFNRAELLDMMKKANMHFKDSMTGNLSKILAALVGSKFNQVSDGVYSLTADAYQSLEAQLA
ncbi:hypothetical protein RZN05_06835 [Sphingomonas sp. HF-S4]|uniref:Uncharacterized protein n=1 Tax=Sphingomonas agrestis TaxID=3080540 RepID=A0ABU3Y5K8_9SPHN|nr:hypothetical protein [Sphingomonas sp. HF-S4]MDV3456694.1 hypothetical protein [Sphingomonas sp. HF-S4]